MSEKSFLFAFFYHPKLFVSTISSLFFVHSGFFFGIKERKNRDVFIYTQKSFFREREREREKKSIMGKKEVIRFVSFRYTTEEKEA
jgi:hypothetical protein